MSDFVPYDRSLSPTAAAVKFTEDLTAAGKFKYNLGQGAETEPAPSGLFPDMHITYGPKYRGQAQIGGDVEARTTVAAWAQQFLGIPAEASTTFLMAENGRVMVRRAIAGTRVLNGVSNDLLMPALRWPMYDDIVRTNHRPGEVSIVDYSNPAGDAVGYELKTAINRRPFAMVTNTPHNPTGKIYSPAWMENLAGELDSANADNQHKTFHILDIPYFYALRATGPGSDHYLDGGYEHVTKTGSPTPSIAIVSLSKALGMAEPGLSIVIVHPEIASKIKGHLTQDGGTSYSQGFYDGIVQGFHKDNYPVHLGHYGKLADKYDGNVTGHLVRDFGNQLLDGDPGMTTVIEVPDILGKVWGIDGRTYVFKDTPDVVECIGNEAGIVTVANGRNGNNALIRVANAPAPLDHDNASRQLSICVRRMQSECGPKPR